MALFNAPEPAVEAAPEGVARVAESGSELAVGPDGKLTYYDRPQTAYLQEGTQVKTHGETRAFLRQVEQAYGQEQARGMVASWNRDTRDLQAPQGEGKGYSELLEEMRLMRKQTVSELKKKRETRYDGEGRHDRDGEVWRTYVNRKYYRG